MSEEKKAIIVEDVIEMLESGKTRKEIQTHYELNGIEAKALFSHELLKGRRTHKERNFKIMTRAEAEEEVVTTKGADVVVDNSVNIEATIKETPQEENTEETLQGNPVNTAEKKPYSFDN